MKKRILWILTGGTFSCVKTENGLAPCSSREQAERVLAAMPEICGAYEVTPLVLMNIDSSDMTTADHKRIADTTDRNISDFDGIVITHGTDTMAYTAAALSVMIKNPPVPIVLTGSQRPFFDKYSDAPKNFADAVAVAGKSTINTVCVVFCGKIMSGNDCTKLDTVADTAFGSKRQDLGEIFGNDIKIFASEKITAGKYSYDSSLCRADGKVVVLSMHPSFDPEIIRLLYSAGIRGFVIRCYGAGGIPEKTREAFGEVIAKGARAVAVTQCLHGGADLGIYAVGSDAQRAGIEDGGYMTEEYASAWLMKKLSDDEM